MGIPCFNKVCLAGFVKHNRLDAVVASVNEEQLLTVIYTTVYSSSLSSSSGPTVDVEKCGAGGWVA